MKKKKWMSVILTLCIVISVFTFPVNGYAEELEMLQTEAQENIQEEEIIEGVFETEGGEYLLESKEVPQEMQAAELPQDEDGYFLIQTPEEFVALGNIGIPSKQQEEWAKKYRLTEDIDLSGQQVKPIGKSSYPFTGSFDGNGFKITGLNLSVSSDKGGLFAYVGSSAIVSDLVVKAPNVMGTSTSTSDLGVIAGENKGIISNCKVESGVITSAASRVGGIAGRNSGTIEKCAVIKTTVESTYANWGQAVGGIVGQNTYAYSPDSKGKIEQCYSTANVAAPLVKYVGGIVGYLEDGSILDSYNLGSVSGKEAVGGLVGYLGNGQGLTRCYSAGDVTAATTGNAFIGALKSDGCDTTDCFYDTEKTLPEGSVSIKTETGLTTQELKALDLGELWSKDAQHNGGLPYLTAVEPERSNEEPEEETVSVEIMVADYSNTTYNYTVSVEPKTVSVALENPVVEDILEASGISYEFTESQQYGKYLTTINGIEALSPDGWMFTLDDKVAPLGVSTMSVKDGEKLLFYYGSVKNGYKAPAWSSLTGSTSGEGTPANPYLLKNAADLESVRNDLTACYQVAAPIDMTGIDFEPIGSAETPFTGTFDGGNYTISNLKISKGEYTQNVGFFGVLYNADVKNVVIQNADVTGGSKLGILAGVAKEGAEGSCVISNCHVQGKVTGLGTHTLGNTDMGGLVGINDGNNTVAGTSYGSYVYSAINNCSADAEVIGKTLSLRDAGRLGGLVGFNRGIIVDSYASGNVSGGTAVGGLVGSNWEQIYDSYAIGHVTAYGTAGGFVGHSNLYTKIENCFSTGNVASVSQNTDGQNFGGFAGAISGTVKNCVSAGTLVPGWSWNGGFVGDFDGIFSSSDPDSLTMVECYGNSVTYIGETIKGIATHINGKDETVNAAAKAVAVDSATAKEKIEALKNQLGVSMPVYKDSAADLAAVKAEAAKYEGSAFISKTMDPSAESINVTDKIVKMKEGQTPDESITLMLEQKQYKGYITNSVPRGKYTLIKARTEKGNETETVIIGFVKNGVFATAEVSVTIESSQGGSDSENPGGGENPGGENPGSGGNSGGGNSGGSSGGGSSSGGTGSTAGSTTEPEKEVKNQSGKTIVTESVAVKVDESGKAVAELNENKILSSVKDAISRAEKAGTKPVLRLELNADKVASQVSAKLSSEVIKTAAKGKEFSMTLDTPLGAVTLSKKALESIAAKTQSTVEISLVKVDGKNLSEAAQAASAGRGVIDLSIKADGAQVSDWTQGKLLVSIPYQLKAGENENQLLIYYANGSQLSKVKESRYDASQKSIIFETNHLSQYMIGYEAVSFIDTAGWYADSVSYLAARDIMKGKGEGKFVPSDDVTRAEFVQILRGLSGADSAANKASAFTDVAADSWYSGAVQWAYEEQISAGSNGKFLPNEKISRQDMAVMLMRYHEKSAKEELLKVNAKVTFADESAIASYAGNAVAEMQQAGIINGKGGNRFDPSANATRAEAAVMISEFIKNTIQ